MDNIRLTEQENKISNYLIAKNGQTVFWEELAQFAKEPQKVKLKSIKRTVSEMRRKFFAATVWAI